MTLTASDRRIASDLSSRVSLVLLVFIFAVSAAMRIHVFRGYVGLDDAEYARLAHSISQGSAVLTGYTGPPVFPLRVGLTVPTAVLFRLFGINEWTLVLYPLVISLASIVLAYACSSLLFGRSAGLVAAALMAVFPWDLDCATKLLPDLPGAFFAAAAVTLILALETKQSGSQWRFFAGGAIAGLGLGLSWLHKESVTYLAPLCAILMVMSARRNWTRAWALWGGVAAGSLVVLLGEVLIYRSLTGDWLFRFHEVERNYQENRKYFFSAGNPFGWTPGQTYRQAVLQRLFVSGPASFFVDRTLLFLPLTGLLATVYGRIRRDRSFLVPAVWLWTVVLMFNFSSSSTTSYVPLALYQRYLYPVFFPAIVIASGFLARTLLEPGLFRVDRRQQGFQFAAVLTAALIAWAAVPQLYYTLRYSQRGWTSDVRAVSTSVGAETAVYADTLTLRALEFYRGYPAKTSWTDFEQIRSGDPIAPGSVVMVNNQYIQWLDRHGGIWGNRLSGYASHSFYRTPPRSWTPVWHNDNLVVYRVDR